MPPKIYSSDNELVTGDIISPIDDDDEFGLRDALSKPARRLRRKMQTKTVQKFIKKRYYSDYKNNIMLELEKLRNRQIKKIRINQNKYKSIGIENRCLK